MKRFSSPALTSACTPHVQRINKMRKAVKSAAQEAAQGAPAHDLTAGLWPLCSGGCLFTGFKTGNWETCNPVRPNRLNRQPSWFLLTRQWSWSSSSSSSSSSSTPPHPHNPPPLPVAVYLPYFSPGLTCVFGCLKFCLIVYSLHSDSFLTYAEKMFLHIFVQEKQHVSPDNLK